MAKILNIDTATETASISLASNGRPIGLLENEKQKDHAAWLQPAIHTLLLSAAWKMTDLDAVAVTEGPGSYTGLRIGMASAKGLCYALQIPLIAIDTLLVMAASQYKPDQEELWYAPMIDARRKEVFAEIFDQQLLSVYPPSPIVLEPASFGEILNDRPVLFSGNGSDKWKEICRHPNALFSRSRHNASYMNSFAEKKFMEKDFANLFYAEPAYLKEFHTHQTH